MNVRAQKLCQNWNVMEDHEAQANTYHVKMQKEAQRGNWGGKFRGYLKKKKKKKKLVHCL